MQRINGGFISNTLITTTNLSTKGIWSLYDERLLSTDNKWHGATLNAKATGGNIYRTQYYVIHEFKSSSTTFTVTSDITGASVIAVGGGGGGSINNFPGSGGAGAFTYHYRNYPMPAGTYTVVVGAGGAAKTGTGYGNGGRGGASWVTSASLGNLSVSGGYTAGAFVTSSGSDGYDYATGLNDISLSYTGTNAWGGAGAGQNGLATQGGNGSTVANSIMANIVAAGGTATAELVSGSYYLAGGGGSGNNGNGGRGYGGHGSNGGSGQTTGGTNSGSGGGGGTTVNGTGANGGSGIVLIYYTV